MDRWEEGFNAGTPTAEEPALPAPGTGADRERQELLRLARELAAERRAEREPAQAELEALKRTLREAAQAVAAKGRELAGLQRRIDAELATAQAERELAVAERARLEERERAVHEVEKELAELRVTLEAREAALEARERDDDDRAAARAEASEPASFDARLSDLARTPS